MFVRIVSPGWENYTGSLGFGATFEEGVSTVDLTPRQVARIGANLQIVDVDTNEQVGPAAIAAKLNASVTGVVIPKLKTAAQEKAEFEFDRKKLAADEEARKEKEAKALEEAQRKAQEQVEAQVIYSRAELEAIAGNDGIGALRKIATPLGVKGRAIGELVTEILAAQAKLTVAE